MVASEHEAKFKSSDSTGRGINFVSENKWKSSDSSYRIPGDMRKQNANALLAISNLDPRRQPSLLPIKLSHDMSDEIQSSPKKSKVDDDRH